ncbi:ABC transporter ATP-binding protein [Kineococcus sp. SYSU DK006]|uniref:ABC transporter ATP-binding protein n=1 Tax=Kineococcus sp. SYSU DK006 TaxID=3383127 RepID=UPI003D7DD6D9
MDTVTMDGTAAAVGTSLHFRGVSMSYPQRQGPPTQVLADVDVRVQPGEFVCLLGPSGCGKSTLLNIAAGLAEPTEGEVLVGDRPVRGPGPDRGVVFQQYALMPWYTVRQNVELGPRCRGQDPAERARAVDEALNAVGLREHAQKYPKQLSGGMKQRTAIARTFVSDPDVILMDEPFAALDAQTRERLQQQLLSLWGQRRKTALFVTHSVQEATLLADRIVVLADDPDVAPQVLTNPLPRPRDPLTAEFTTAERAVHEALNRATTKSPEGEQ